MREQPATLDPEVYVWRTLKFMRNSQKAETKKRTAVDGFSCRAVQSGDQVDCLLTVLSISSWCLTSWWPVMSAVFSSDTSRDTNPPTDFAKSRTNPADPGPGARRSTYRGGWGVSTRKTEHADLARHHCRVVSLVYVTPLIYVFVLLTVCEPAAGNGYCSRTVSTTQRYQQQKRQQQKPLRCVAARVGARRNQINFSFPPSGGGGDCQRQRRLAAGRRPKASPPSRDWPMLFAVGGTNSCRQQLIALVWRSNDTSFGRLSWRTEQNK